MTPSPTPLSGVLLEILPSNPTISQNNLFTLTIRVNASNRQAVTDIIGYLSGTKALPNQVQLLDLYAQSGLVPECAMRVTRSKDGGNIFPYQPTSPCSMM